MPLFGSARKAEGWFAIEPIFLNSDICTSLNRPALGFGFAILRSEPSGVFAVVVRSLVGAIRDLILTASLLVSSNIVLAAGLSSAGCFLNVNWKSGSMGLIAGSETFVGVCSAAKSGVIFFSGSVCKPFRQKPSHRASSSGLAVLAW